MRRKRLTLHRALSGTLPILKRTERRPFAHGASWRGMCKSTTASYGLVLAGAGENNRHQPHGIANRGLRSSPDRQRKGSPNDNRNKNNQGRNNGNDHNDQERTSPDCARIRQSRTRIRTPLWFVLRMPVGNRDQNHCLCSSCGSFKTGKNGQNARRQNDQEVVFFASTPVSLIRKFRPPIGHSRG